MAFAVRRLTMLTALNTNQSMCFMYSLTGIVHVNVSTLDRVIIVKYRLIYCTLLFVPFSIRCAYLV